MNKTTVTTEQKELTSKKRSLLIFWLRMLGWVISGVGVPITAFSIKFGLFTEYGYSLTTDELGNVTGTKIALNGWGIISIVLICLAIMEILNYIIDSKGSGYSYSKQILHGVKARIVPLALAIGVCYWLKGVVDQVLFCLVIIGLSQIAAICVNPLPQWSAEKRGEEDYSTIVSACAKAIKTHFDKKKGGK